MKSSCKYRIYPTKSQESKLENTLSMCRHLYNWSLTERITSYQAWKYAKDIEKIINPDKKKVIFSSSMGQVFYIKEKESAALKLLTTVEVIFGILFNSIWCNVPRKADYNSQADNLPELKKERPWYKGVHSQVLQNTMVSYYISLDDSSYMAQHKDISNHTITINEPSHGTLDITQGTSYNIGINACLYCQAWYSCTSSGNISMSWYMQVVYDNTYNIF